MEEYQSENPIQNPEILQRKAEMSSKSIDISINKELTFTERMFPNEVTRLRQGYVRELVEQKIRYEVDMISTLRKQQNRIFNRFMEERYNEFVVVSGKRLFDLAAAAILDAVRKKEEIDAAIDEMMGVSIDCISKIDNERLRKTQEDRYYKNLEAKYQLLDSVFANLEGNIREALRHKAKQGVFNVN